MRVSKKVFSAVLALVMGVSLCGIGATAWEDNTVNSEDSEISVERVGNSSFYLPVSYISDYTSTEMIKKVTTNSYASVTITTYKNTTNIPSRLRMRAYDVTKKEKATIFHKVTGIGEYHLPYIITGNLKDYHRCDADVSADATAGGGILRGYWVP